MDLPFSPYGPDLQARICTTPTPVPPPGPTEITGVSKLLGINFVVGGTPAGTAPATATYLNLAFSLVGVTRGVDAGGKLVLLDVRTSTDSVLSDTWGLPGAPTEPDTRQVVGCFVLPFFNLGLSYSFDVTTGTGVVTAGLQGGAFYAINASPTEHAGIFVPMGRGTREVVGVAPFIFLFALSGVGALGSGGTWGTGSSVHLWGCTRVAFYWGACIPDRGSTRRFFYNNGTHTSTGGLYHGEGFVGQQGTQYSASIFIVQIFSMEVDYTSKNWNCAHLFTGLTGSFYATFRGVGTSRMTTLQDGPENGTLTYGLFIGHFSGSVGFELGSYHVLFRVVRRTIYVTRRGGVAILVRFVVTSSLDART